MALGGVKGGKKEPTKYNQFYFQDNFSEHFWTIKIKNHEFNKVSMAHDSS